MKKWLIIAMALGLSACATQKETVVTPTNWQLAKWTATDGKVVSIPEGKPIQVMMDSESISGFAGCNRFRGTYKATGENMTFGLIASTMMACLPPAMKFEQKFHHTIGEQTGKKVIDGGKMTWTMQSGDVLVWEAVAAAKNK